MAFIPKNYLKPIGRPYEIIGGIISAIIGGMFLLFAGWMSYRTYLVGNLFQLPVLIIVAISIIFALGFSSIAYKLISGNTNKNKQLLSNFTLYLMGWFFLIAGVAITGVFIYLRISGDNYGGSAFSLVMCFLIGIGAIRLAKQRK